MSEVIKEFLVSLGYEQKGQAQFLDSIGKATKSVVGLAMAVKAASLAVVAGTAKIASSMEDMYYASQRTGATVAQINAISYAASQMGTTAEAARGSLEGLAQRLRTNPGYGGLVRSLVGGNVDLQNSAEVLERLSTRFREMARTPGGYAVATRYADALGISEPVMRAMIEGMDRFNADYRRRLRTFGLDTEQAARAAQGFMRQLRESRSNFEILAQRVMLALAPQLTQELARFNRMLEENGTTIEAIIVEIARAILQAGNLIGEGVLLIVNALKDLYNWYRTLSPHTQEFIRTVGLIVVAWRALNLSFLASPIGIIIALTAAIVALIDDYQTWKRGGESLIDWSKWEPAIQQLMAALEVIGRWFVEAVELVGGWQTAFALLAAYIAGSWLATITRGFAGVVAAAGSTGLLALMGRLGLVGAAAGLVYTAGRIGAANAGETEALNDVERMRTQDPDAYREYMRRNQVPEEVIERQIRRGTEAETPEERRERRDTEEHQKTIEELLQEGNEAALDFMDALRVLAGMEPARVGNPAAGGAAGRGGGGTFMATGGSGMSTPVTNEQQGARARQAFDYFVSQGWTPEQAAGIVANIHAESGFNEGITGDRGRAFGLAQWHPDRQARFQRFAGRDIRGSSFEQQLAFIHHELNNQERPAGDALRATTTAQQAGATVSQRYERPADIQREAIRRAATAAGYLARFRGQAAPRPAVSPTGGLRLPGGIELPAGPGAFPGLPPGITPQSRLGVPTPGAGVAINQNTQITVNGAGDPNAVGRSVAREQRNVNADLARNAQGAVR